MPSAPVCPTTTTAVPGVRSASLPFLVTLTDSSGATVKVTLAPKATVTVTKKGKLADLTPGTAVVVGETGKDGSVTATTVTQGGGFGGAEIPPPARAVADGSEARILVVDDEPYIADLLTTGLRFVGFDVRTAGTGRQALEIAREFEPDLWCWT